MGDFPEESQAHPLFDDRFRGVHDLLVPRLSYVSFQLSAVQTQVDGAAADAVASCVDLIDKLVGDVRRLLAEGAAHDDAERDGVTRGAPDAAPRGSAVC